MYFNDYCQCDSKLSLSLKILSFLPFENDLNNMHHYQWYLFLFNTWFILNGAEPIHRYFLSCFQLRDVCHALLYHDDVASTEQPQDHFPSFCGLAQNFQHRSVVHDPLNCFLDLKILRRNHVCLRSSIQKKIMNIYSN